MTTTNPASNGTLDNAASTTTQAPGVAANRMPQAEPVKETAKPGKSQTKVATSAADEARKLGGLLQKIKPSACYDKAGGLIPRKVATADNTSMRMSAKWVIAAKSGATDLLTAETQAGWIASHHSTRKANELTGEKEFVSASLSPKERTWKVTVYQDGQFPTERLFTPQEAANWLLAASEGL